MSRDHWTFRKFARVVTTFVAFVALMSSVLTVVFVGTASAAAATLTPVGSFITASSTGLTTASATLVNPGDVLAIWVQSQTQSTAGLVTAIGSSGAGAIGTAVKAIAYTTVQHGPPFNDDEIWYAPVTAAGAVTLTFTWSGTTTGINFEYSTQEFQPSSSATYSTDLSGHLEVSASSTTVGFPSLAQAGANELYLGYNSNNTNGTYGAPTTAGYTAESGATGDAIIFDPSTASGVQAPITTATTTGSVQSAIGAMIIATAVTGNTVTFNANGGTGTMTNETASTPTALTPNGYTFAGHTFTGWNTVALGGGTAYANGATYPFSANVTLYAQWAPTFTVTFNGNTNTGGATAAETDSTATALTLNGFTKTGNVFTGWNTVALGGGTAYADGATYPFTANVTLYAQWAPAFTVTFNGNTNTGGATAPETAAAATALTLNGFTKTGNVFTGWNTVALGGGTAYADGASYPFTSSTTLYAQWTPGFTVTFNGNSNTGGSTAPQSANTATALTANGFTRSGYAFTGWNTIAGGGGTAYANGASYPFTSSTTLYAQWTVSGGGGGGGGGGGTTLKTLTVTAGSQSITVGGSVTASSTVSGLTSPDTGTVSSATYTYAGTGTTIYAASSTAPAVAGTYSVTPSAATVAITPTADAANYSTTYTYVGGALTIAAVVVVVPPVVGPHATRVVGQAFVGKSRTLTIVGTNFTANPGVKSNQSGAVVRVRSKSSNRIVLLITVRKGVRPGTHQFTITASGKTCRIGYITR